MRAGVLPLTIAFLALLLLPVSTATVQAQVTAGSIAGSVIDPSGRPIPGAAVVASDSLRASTRTAVCDEEGRYRFTDLAPALYDVSAAAQGFEQVQRPQRAGGGRQPPAARFPPARRGHCPGGRGDGAPDSDPGGVRRSRCRHRSAAHPVAAAEQAGLPPAGDAHAGGESAVSGLGALLARIVCDERQRRPGGVQQLPARRRRQQRRLRQPLRRPAPGGQHPGIQDRHQQLQRRVRAQRRRPGERHHEERQQPVRALGLRVLPQPGLERAQRVRHRGRRAPVRAQPVRRECRRAAVAQPDVRLREPRLSPPAEFRDAPVDGPDRPAARRQPVGAPGDGVRPVHTAAVPRQRHPGKPHRPDRAQRDRHVPARRTGPAWPGTTCSTRRTARTRARRPSASTTGCRTRTS